MRKFDVEEVDIPTAEEYWSQDELFAEEFDPDNPNKEEKQKIIIDNDTDIILSISIMKDRKEYNVVSSININEDLLVKILNDIGYGEIGWERFVLVKEQNILD